MSLEGALSDIITRLREGKFLNEQSISQGIVLRLLQELGWDTWDTTVVWPEYQTGEGRVDYALCSPPRKPVVFIEVKQPGKAEDAVRQALEYAFHAGAPLVLLTDGRTWSFYLPAEQGSYEDRRVYKLDLYERPLDEAVAILERYLSHDAIVSGRALEAARKEYRSRNRRSQARAAIPDAWRELVLRGDELLVELISTAVESKSGVQPDPDDVVDFLTDLSRTEVELSPREPLRREKAPAKRPAPSPMRVTQKRIVLMGKEQTYSTAKSAMVAVLKELARKDRHFLERCAQHPNAQGRKRRYIARTTSELYPDREDLRDRHVALPGGWLVATNLNNALKRTIIYLAADVAGLTVGKDIIVDI